MKYDEFWFWFGVWTSALALIIAGTVTFTGLVPTAWEAKIVRIAADFFAINNVILTAAKARGYISARNAASILPDASSVARVLILGLAVTGLLGVGFVGTAHAATPPKPRPAAANLDPLQKIMDDIASKSATFVIAVTGAIQEADDDAATLINPSDLTSFRDPIAHACYPAQIKFLKSLPVIQPISAKPPYDVIVLFQRKRDLVAQIKAGLPGYLKVGCAALLGDEETIFIQTLGMIGVTIGAGTLTGIFPAAAPLTLPALTLPGI
jgi:hypothetical protein